MGADWRKLPLEVGSCATGNPKRRRAVASGMPEEVNFWGAGCRCGVDRGVLLGEFSSVTI
jgi:hypothetical protein